MEILHQYYYRTGKLMFKAVAYTIATALLVALGVFCFTRWDLTFMFFDWKGYLMMGVYGLMTLAMALSAAQAFGKMGKARRGMPALLVCPDSFVVYNRDGLPMTVPFAMCEQVRVKCERHYVQGPYERTLIVKYHTQDEPLITQRLEVDLTELDRPQQEVERQVLAAYRQHASRREAPISQSSSFPSFPND